MKRKLFFLFSLLVSVGGVIAQTPYEWSFSVRQISDRTYEVHCTADIKPPWHVYSQFTPQGGPLPTKIEFIKNPLYALSGAAKENGKLITHHEAVFDVDVKYFEGPVDFVQIVKMKGAAKTNINGSVTFMVCDEEQCLPPTTRKFSLTLNGSGG